MKHTAGLEMLIRQLEETDQDLLSEILVIHNSESSDTTQYKSLTRDSRVRVISSSPGLSNARNKGLYEARSEIIAYLDHDVKISDGWAKEIVTLFQRGHKIGVIGGEVFPNWVAGKPEWVDPVIEAAYSAQRFSEEFDILDSSRMLVGANIAFRKEPLQEVGGFPSYLGRVGHTLLSNEEMVPQQKLEDAGFIRVGSTRFSVTAPIPEERISKSWLVRRFVWQAVSDELSEAFLTGDPQKPENHVVTTISSLELMKIRSNVRALLSGKVTNNSGESAGALPTSHREAEVRHPNRLRVIDFTTGGHESLAYRLSSISGARLSIIDANPWLDRDGEIFRDVAVEVQTACRSGEMVLLLTADPLIHQHPREFRSLMKALEGATVRAVIHRRPAGYTARKTRSLLEDIPGLLALTSNRETSGIDLHDSRTLLRHPIMRPEIAKIAGPKAKGLLGIPVKSTVFSLIGSQLHKDTTHLAEAILNVIKLNDQVHFLIAGACRVDFFGQISDVANSFPDKVTNFLRTPDNNFDFHVLPESQVEVCIAATDIGIIPGAGGDYFPSTALDYFNINKPIVISREISWSSVWQQGGVALSYDPRNQRSVTRAFLAALHAPAQIPAHFKTALSIHSESAINQSLNDIFSERQGSRSCLSSLAAEKVSSEKC